MRRWRTRIPFGFLSASASASSPVPSGDESSTIRSVALGSTLVMALAMRRMFASLVVRGKDDPYSIAELGRLCSRIQVDDGRQGHRSLAAERSGGKSADPWPPTEQRPWAGSSVRLQTFSRGSDEEAHPD